VRRRFDEAKTGGKDKRAAETALVYIQDLYIVEQELRIKLKKGELTNEEFVKKRKAETYVTLSLLRQWLDQKLLVQNEGDKSLIAKAVRYASNQWHKLVRYLLDAELTPDNNLAENAIRPFTVGRKNWLFFRCPGGAASGCVIYSLVETSKANGLNPAAYLEYLFEKAPLVKQPEDWAALLPWNAKLNMPAPTGLC
jgi:transposase